MNTVDIIIPFLNEEENIPSLVLQLNEFFSQERIYKPRVIFVDDGSTDNSVDLLKQSSHHYDYKIVKLSKNFGSHAALRAGIAHSSADYITFMYADLQDPLDLIDQMYKSIQNESFDIVWAVRKSTENGFFERTFSRMYSNLMIRFVSENYPEQGFDIVMFNTKVGKKISDNVESNSSIFLQILLLGFKQTTIFYDKLKRQKGKSKWTLSKKIKLLIDSFISYSYFPIRLVSIVGILLFVVGVLWSMYLIFMELMFDSLNEGWPQLMSVLMIGFGITNISLGVIAEYLWRTLDASRKRPVFVIDEIIDKNE